MTICIAAICEANVGGKIVFCADRLVTDANGLTFEQGMPKIWMLLPHCLIMNAGDALRGDAIIRDVFNKLKSREPESLEKLSIMEIAEIIKELYISHRDKAIEMDLFGARGLDRKSFYLNMNAFKDWFALLVDNEVRNYRFDVAFIILGFDIYQEKKSGIANLYQISNNGELQFANQNGFCMVGIGELQSLPEITKEPYSPNTTLSDCVVRTFWAKKSSERMVSVGKETTDLGIMFLELDQNSGKIVAKNILLTDEFKNKLLLEPFEKQKQAVKQLTTEVQKNINEVFQGKKAIGQTSS